MANVPVINAEIDAPESEEERKLEREEKKHEKNDANDRGEKKEKDEGNARSLGSQNKKEDKEAVMEGESKKIPKVTLAQFFDIIGQINIILRTDTSLRISKSSYPFESVRAGIISLSKTDKLPVMFEVFTAGDDKRPWIRTLFPCIKDFKTFDEYMINVWRCLIESFDCAKSVLVCPHSTYWFSRNPNPAQLGYPTDMILHNNAMVHDIIDGIVRNINLRDRSATLVDATVCGDIDILTVSSNLVTYGEEIMPRIRDVMQLLLNLCSANERSQTTLQKASVVTHFNPVYDFRYVGYMYNRLPFYVHLAYDVTVHSIAPQIPITPLNDSVIIKQGQTSATRSGFLPDIISVQYVPGMAADFAVIIATLLAPGYSQIDIDWSDVPAEATEMVGFIALLSKAIFMRSNGPLDSITDESARRVEERIVTLGVRNQLLVREDNRNPNAYPLDNVRVARALNVRFLNLLRTDLSGNGWMNANRNVRNMDGFGGIYRTPMEGRPVYAVNCSDYNVYLDDENAFKHEWVIYEAIEGFVYAWARKNNTLSEAMIMYLDNLLRYSIRMNEYLRFNFHAGLRLPENIINRLIGEEKVRQCLQIPIKSKSILAFAKSVGNLLPYERRIPLLQQLKVESKIVQEMCYLRAMFNIIRDETLRYGVNAEYGRNKIWGMCVSTLEDNESPYSTHLYMLKERMMLSNLPRNYVIEVEGSELYNRIFPVFINGMFTHSIRNGWVREFYFKSTNFRVNTIEQLLVLARDGEIRVNRVEDFQLPPYIQVNFPNQIRPWLRSCSPNYELNILTVNKFAKMISPLRVEFDMTKLRPEQDVPFSFKFPETDRRICNSLEFHTCVFGVLKILTNEVRVPDHISDLAVVRQSVALRSTDISDTIMPVTEFVAKIGQFSHRVILLRDSAADFSDVFLPLPI